MKTIEIRTGKHQLISAKVFESSKAKKVLIIASAMGVKQSFYKKFAKFASQQGVTVLTFDYSGIGESLNQPIRKLKNNAHDWGKADLESVIQYAKITYTDSEIVILGHSIGGQIIGFAPSSFLAKKIILITAQSGYWRFWKGFNSYLLWANWKFLFPVFLILFGCVPSKKINGMENLPKNVAKQWSKWCLSPNYFFDYISSQNLYFGNIRVPLTSVSVEDDSLAPKKAVDWLAYKYENATSIERIHWTPEEFGVKKIGHFGIFNENFKGNIWNLLVNEIINP